MVRRVAGTSLLNSTQKALLRGRLAVTFSIFDWISACEKALQLDGTENITIKGMWIIGKFYYVTLILILQILVHNLLPQPAMFSPRHTVEQSKVI